MIYLPPGMVNFWGQQIEVHDLAVVVLLILLEGLLSIDNALVLGLLAKRLPKHEQSRALWYGLAGAFVFRVLAILLASVLLQWTFAKFLGGAYLVYIAVRHLFFQSQEEAAEKIVLDEHGHPLLVDERTGKELGFKEEELEIRQRSPIYMTPERRKQLGLASFWPTVLVIELTDIAFAVDSILAAIAMVGAPPAGTPPDALHPKLWVVILGGLLGLVLMRIAARLFVGLLERFPRFETSAYLLVMVIGLKLLADWGFNSDWSFEEPRWLADRMGAWSETFHDLEVDRRQLVGDYKAWLRETWPLGLAEKHHPPGNHGELPEGQLDHDPQHVPHLLDFHSPRRPEFIVFWGAMLVCFLIGFLPQQASEPKDASAEQKSPDSPE